MAEGGLLPASLLALVNRIEGFGTNTVKLLPVGKTSAYVAGDFIQFQLPSNVVWCPHSFKILFSIALSCGTADNYVRLPANINSLIEKVEILMAGTVVSQGSNFTNVFNAARAALTGKRACSATGHPIIPRHTNYDFGATQMGADDQAFSNKSYLAFDEFLGFMESAPMFLDGSLLPEVTMRITLANNNVLGQAGAAADTRAGFQTEATTFASTYTLNDVHAICELVQFNNDAYSKMLQAQLNAENMLEIPFKQYPQTNMIHVGATRFTASTQSLDATWILWKKSGGKGKINGITGTLDIHSETSTAQFSHITGEQYVTDEFTFKPPVASGKTVGDIEIQLTMNGSLFPQYYAPAADWLLISKNSIGKKNFNPDLTLARYGSTHFVQCFRHSMPGDNVLGNISGINTRQANLQGVVSTQNTDNANYECHVVSEITSTLRVGLNRSVLVIP